MNSNTAYKQTEIGLIPSDWDICTLSEAVDFLDGQRRPIKSSDREKITGEYPYYGASGIIDYVDDYIYDDELILLGEDGENILSRNLPLAFKVKGKIWVNNHAHVLKPKNEFDISYLTDYLESLDYSLLNSGTAQPKLNKQACLNLKIVKPTLAEQTAIATALSDTDALIATLEKLIAKKRAIKQGAMQQLLKPKEGDALSKSKGWVVKRLGEVLKVKHGKSQKNVEDVNGCYPILGTGGFMAYSNTYLYNKPSVLIGRKGTIDKPQYMDIPFWTVDTLFFTEVFNDFNPKYIFYAFSLIDWYSYNEASGVPSLNAKTIESIEKEFPSLEEQTRIATILSDMDAEITALEAKLAKTKQVKMGMMQQLLTGKIRLV
jgi:type I restriction enzyme S subunit